MKIDDVRELLAQAYVNDILQPDITAGSLYQIGYHKWLQDCQDAGIYLWNR